MPILRYSWERRLRRPTASTISPTSMKRMLCQPAIVSPMKRAIVTRKDSRCTNIRPRIAQTGKKTNTKQLCAQCRLQQSLGHPQAARLHRDGHHGPPLPPRSHQRTLSHRSHRPRVDYANEWRDVPSPRRLSSHIWRQILKSHPRRTKSTSSQRGRARQAAFENCQKQKKSRRPRSSPQRSRIDRYLPSPIQLCYRLHLHLLRDRRLSRVHSFLLQAVRRSLTQRCPTLKLSARA